MLDFLLVLGQVPGTDFQITFNEMVAFFCVLYLMHVYLKHSIEIAHWFKWLRHRIGINYRKQKRHLRSYIRLKRYRLAIFERRIIRRAKTYLRQRRHAFFMVFYRRYSALKRYYYIKVVQWGRLLRQVKRSRAFQNFITVKNFVSPPV